MHLQSFLPIDTTPKSLGKEIVVVEKENVVVEKENVVVGKENVDERPRKMPQKQPGVWSLSDTMESIRSHMTPEAYSTPQQTTT